MALPHACGLIALPQAMVVVRAVLAQACSHAARRARCSAGAWGAGWPAPTCRHARRCPRPVPPLACLLLPARPHPLVASQDACCLMCSWLHRARAAPGLGSARCCADVLLAACTPFCAGVSSSRAQGSRRPDGWRAAYERVGVQQPARRVGRPKKRRRGGWPTWPALHGPPDLLIQGLPRLLLLRPARRQQHACRLDHGMQSLLQTRCYPAWAPVRCPCCQHLPQGEAAGAHDAPPARQPGSMGHQPQGQAWWRRLRRCAGSWAARQPGAAGSCTGA